MKAFFKLWVVRLLALLIAGSISLSQTFAQDRVPFRQEELDQMLAPIALYPDSLLSQVLMASTYPLEVVQASRWSRANPGLKGQDAVRAVEGMDWDPSVKSLVAFPQVLTAMDQKLGWTERLGEAFLAQQADVMDTVQGLRRRAEAAGNLRSSDQMRVTREGEIIVIEPPGPQVVYVPYYSPVVVFGPWWWPAYPPVYWGPPPGYYAWPAYAPGFYWGSGIVISAGFFFGHPNWHHRHVTVVHNHITNVTVNRRTTAVNRNVAGANARPVIWQHDPAHRRGAPFRNPAARERFEQTRGPADARRDANRTSSAQPARPADDNRTADIRQRRLEERRAAAPQNKREGTREQQRDAAVNRLTPGNDGDRATAARNAERARSAETRKAPAETRKAPAETRKTQPEGRTAPAETRAPQPDTRARPEPRRTQPERAAPQANDQRQERRDTPRPQTRGIEQRPAVAAPVARPAPRPAATTPAMRVEARQVPEGRRRAEVRANSQPARAMPRQSNVASERAPAPRPAASTRNHAPRMESHRPSGGNGARVQGNGNSGRQIERPRTPS